MNKKIIEGKCYELIQIKRKKTKQTELSGAKKWFKINKVETVLRNFTYRFLLQW